MVYFKLTSTGCVSEISVRSGYSSGSNVAAGRGSAITWSFKHRQTTHTKQMSVWETKHDKTLFVLATQNTPLSGLQKVKHLGKYTWGRAECAAIDKPIFDQIRTDHAACCRGKGNVPATPTLDGGLLFSSPLCRRDIERGAPGIHIIFRRVP